MPAIVGNVNVNELSGVLNVGDVYNIAPTAYFTTYAGGGSFNAGERLTINNSPSVINVYGSDAFVQSSILPDSHMQGIGGGA